MNYLHDNFPSEYLIRELDDNDKLQIQIKIFSSPFLRTVETANILLSELLAGNLMVHPEIIIHDDLRERNFGKFELKSDHESYSRVWALDESSVAAPDKNLNEYKKIGVETCEETCSRMCNVIHEIEQQSKLLKGQHLVAILVSHGDPSQILQTAFENVNANLHRSLNHLGISEWRIFGRKINN
jgi:broad specificity phosphatase PhoE